MHSTRLWCLWELFTLLAFGSPESAAKRVVFKPLHQDVPACELLKAFDVKQARCYSKTLNWYWEAPAQRHRGAEAQKDRGAEEHKHRGTEAQRHSGDRQPSYDLAFS